ncbi:signal peptide peptidase SppA [Treponema sp. Marseille-Q3903]|uniref:signal peptide peptidase SppA n=1 Tax=Treponema sp. Marseille-Q3903 TaxID=2766703 RepID=UPI0016525226|nr:signal peptide peptidase SppA [Treponema sp. Marseille-Q3903]MBC6713935.1 signal peptide peptidase SppA [Treponema sp. Marseille-Q3903]
MSKKFRKGFITFIAILILLIVYIALDIFHPVDFPIFKFNRSRIWNNSNTTNEYNASQNFDRKEASAYRRGSIAALYIEGTIGVKNIDYDQDWLLETIDYLKNDKKNVALAVYINSPGGAVYQSDEVYMALQDYKTSGKPIFVYQGPIAASGGYYISCAADKIYANRNTLTGSIGVLMGTSYDLTGLFEKLGIKSTTVHSGSNKNMMNYNEPFSDEQKKIMQSMCDECYEQFVSIVANSRSIKYETAKKLSDGRLYSAKQALENGLIDKIDSWENMLVDMAEDELSKPGIKVVTYKYERRRKRLIDYMVEKANDYTTAKTAAALGLPERVIKDMNRQKMIPMYVAPCY